MSSQPHFKYKKKSPLICPLCFLRSVDLQNYSHLHKHDKVIKSSLVVGYKFTLPVFNANYGAFVQVILHQLCIVCFFAQVEMVT